MVEEKIRKDPPVEPIDFSLKTLRDTFCQMNIDMNPANLSAVSVQMGHATTNTTEKHYGRLKENKALEILELEWVKQGAKSCLIESEEESSGSVEV
jgi:integrase